MDYQRWIRSSNLLALSAFIFMVAAVAFAAYGIYTLPEDQGHAAGFAGFVMAAFAGLSILFFLIALILAYLMRRGGMFKSISAVILMAAGAFVYYTSGFFAGFIPVFALAMVIGLLALYEEHMQ